MGLFRRNRDARGLYRGDAPVSAPGMDGAAPSAYAGQAFDDHEAHAPGAPDAAGTWSPGSVGSMGASGWESASAPTDVPDGGYSAGQFDQSGASPGGPSYSAPGMQPPTTQSPYTQSPYTQPPNTPPPSMSNTGMTPQAQAAIRLALNQGPRSGRAGGITIVAVLLFVLIPVGIAVYFGMQAATSAISGVEGLQGLQPGVPEGQPGAPNGTPQGVTTMGEPAAISFDGADFEVTVFGVTSQPGDGWGYARADSDPMLVVDAQISRTDPGTQSVRFLGWNWSVVGLKGERVMGDIITNYQPDLDGPELVGGQTLRGFITFSTANTQTSLTVADGPIGKGLATWHIDAETPKAVDGVIGKPAQAEISRPGFTVLVGPPAVVPKKAKRIGYYPESGQYLVMSVKFAGVAGTQGHIGNVDSKAFVFTSDGAPALSSTFGGVTGAFSFVSIDASKPEAGFLAFDTAATSGTLQLLDSADRAVITWQVNAG